MATVYKGVGVKIAKLPGVQPTLDTAADVILARAEALATARVDTGSYLKSLGTRKIRGERGVMDREVYADDPAALSIEFGHLAEKKKGAPTWVPGQRILLNALYNGM